MAPTLLLAWPELAGLVTLTVVVLAGTFVVIRRREARHGDRSGTMTVVEHLEELRNRLIVSVLAVAVGGIGGWFLYGPVFKVLTNGFCSFMTTHPELAFNRSRPCALAATSVAEPFLLKIKVVAFLGLVLALPVVLYQLWRFITPGLLPKERRFAAPFVIVSILLFAMGTWFAFLTLPKGLNFLLGFAGTARIAIVMTISNYVGFVFLLILAFGLAFEFPVVLMSLTLVGVLSSSKLREWRRYAIVIIAVAAAVVTPSQDWFTMTALMVPLLVFYELSILTARLLKK